jgi:hypothetical protein
MSQHSGVQLCTRSEVCGLPAALPQQKPEFCILHYPAPGGKNLASFEAALTGHLGKTGDLRGVVFPSGMPEIAFSNRTFARPVDFTGVVAQGNINLAKATFNGGLTFGADQVRSLHLNGASINGPLILDVKQSEFGISLDGVTVAGSARIAFGPGVEFHAEKATFQSDLLLTAPRLRNLRMTGSRFEGSLTVRGQVYREAMFAENVFDFRDVEFLASVDFSDSQWAGDLLFDNAKFGESATLDLSRAVVSGRLSVTGASLPSRITLNATTVVGAVVIAADQGAPLVRLSAAATRPRFRAAVTLRNVDLSDCLVVGHIVRVMEFSGLQWKHYRGRWVMFDEVAYREGMAAPPRDIREAYQALKEAYRARGDHHRSGDFHYGEMEMKRREAGRFGRVFCVEFVYWLSNGYGTRWPRAAALLFAFVLLFAGVYRFSETRTPLALADWLLFSVQTATFQKPAPPFPLSRASAWAQFAESVLGPAQIAMLILALRMRVRR